MQRIVRGLSATLSHTFYVDGTATNPSPDAATVTITRDNGTVLVAAAAATDTGAGTVSYTLTPAQTVLLDTLTVAWTATFGGQAQAFTDIVEIVGGVLFTVAQARAVNPLADTVKYPPQKIIEARTLVETALEDACGVAFVPRYRREQVNGQGGRELVLSMPRVRSIRSASLDGTAFTAGELADIVPSGTSVVYTPNRWTAGFRNYEVVYEHGYDEPPPRVTNAALLLARRYLVDSPVSDRATSLTTEDGTTQFLVTAGVRQAVFDIPECNAVVAQYSLNACVA